MKREFSSRIFLNRSEMNAAQSQLKKIGVKTLPQLFRLALENLDTNLADEVLHLKADIENLKLEATSLREEIKVADKTVELHKRNCEHWQQSAEKSTEQQDDAEKALREEREKYEKEVAVVDALEKDFNEMRDRADEFEEILYQISVAAGCAGAKIESLAARVRELRTARNKFHSGYIFLCQDLGLDSNKYYDMDDFHNEFKVLFALLEDDQDAHLRLGLRLKNIFARYNNASRTRNEYFDLLCKRLALDSSKPYSLNDFDVAFDRLLGFEDEDNSFEKPTEKESFWERIKRLFRQKS